MAMTVRTTDLNQDATYWAPAGNDGFGGVAYVSPVMIKCRWQSKRDLVRNSEGKEVVTNAIVYVDRHLALQGYLALGDHLAVSDPTSVGSEVLALGSSPDLGATEELLKAWL